MQNQNTSRIEAQTEQNVRKIIEIERTHLKGRTFGERFAKLIANFSGSTWFALLNLVWFVGWIGYNLLFPDSAFDPYPFTFLTLVVSLEAIFLSIFLLIAQNQETRLTEHRDHLDLQINLLAEQENTKMLEILEAIAEKIGVPAKDEAMRTLKEAAEPEKLAEQIEQAEVQALGEEESVASIIRSDS
jgi:uncharacterized membrane protein